MLTDPLWGGILDAVELDVAAKALSLAVRVTSGENSRRYEVRFLSVSELHLYNAIDAPWDYAEITELHFEHDSTGKLRFEVLLWSEEASMSGRCEAVTVDGTDLDVRD